MLTLSAGYDKNVPPFKMKSFVNNTITPVTVNVTITLLKMMGIDEDKNTIDLKFEIMLEWLDYRLSFNNLKEQTYLNALTEDDKKSIWLPIVVFDNTDQGETTRLGVEWEWSTSVTIAREGNFTRYVYYQVLFMTDLSFISFENSFTGVGWKRLTRGKSSKVPKTT